MPPFPDYHAFVVWIFNTRTCAVCQYGRNVYWHKIDVE